ncbi:hypothetical protein PMIN06_010851 [Paraphaeosphaeria minitans]|uniref:Uncharacterized protein n=1 Tax=Paraphaeosphaeria minitans TaxID=565426 RepID=A0A9P6KNB9_9PLEO|nr:hypothetical protein PMIN01_09663 [Paraphaeosphaeria minitans]
MVANIFSRRITTPTTESSIPLSIKPRIERQKGKIRVSAMSLQCNMQRVRRRVLPEPSTDRLIFPFLGLPRKIRYAIYAHYIALAVAPEIPVNATRTDAVVAIPGPLPSLCYANRKTRSECTPLVFLDAALVVPDVLAIERLTRYLEPRVCVLVTAPVHTLVFAPAVSWRPHLTHTAKALLAACPALRQVKIGVPHAVCVEEEWSVVGEEVGVGCKDVCVSRLRGRKEVIDQMDLCCLIDCEALESVTLVCHGGEGVARRLSTKREVVFMPLIVWARKNICRGGRLRLVVEYVG